MKRLLYVTLLLACPAWSQSVDSTTNFTIPLKSNFRSGFMLEPSFAYTLTQLTAIKSFFRANQVEYNKKLDRVVAAGFGYRRQRMKAMIHSFFGLNQRLLPPKTSGNAPLIAQRLDLSGIAIFLGYDIANARNNRAFINAGVGSIRYEYTLFRPTNQQVPFQTIFQYSPPVSVPSLYLDSGYWDVNVEIVQREKRRDTFQWMSRLGYRRGFKATSWQSEAYQLVDAPQDRIGQFYLQVGLYISHNRSSRPN
ncbi:hypothetical protein GO755_36105 [Spirosoma sp. HMF4905]|uniref:DUF2490 domain-containing protein n=1 Tax=Spirosoma arboris TaxID=2682092 RepID=A0A7K1SNW3_9BACT|nr:hypothetical protein [Spirosoma arboris]MVM35502.1 hypothetical protein [Spirosoma arboris]